MQHMRARKREIALGRAPSIAQHTKELINWHNEDHAKTLEEIIDLAQRRRTRIRGSGKCKHWVPMSCLRVCWGLKPRPRICKKPRVRLRGKQTAFRMAAPTSMSTQAWAALSRGPPQYLQKIRDAMAELFMNIQEHKLNTIRAYKTCFGKSP